MTPWRRPRVTSWLGLGKDDRYRADDPWAWHNFPGAIEFVIAVLAIIVVIFVRMYGPRRRSGPRTTHRTSRQTVRRTVRRSADQRHEPGHGHEPGHQPGQPGHGHQPGHQPGKAVNDGRRSSSKRRAGRP